MTATIIMLQTTLIFVDVIDDNDADTVDDDDDDGNDVAASVASDGDSDGNVINNGEAFFNKTLIYTCTLLK